MFEPIVLTNRFPEAHGFVLLDPVRLEGFCDGAATGKDLLTRFSTTDDGGNVSRDGIAIPMVDVEAGDYTVVIRHSDSPGPAQRPKLRSSGWILGTETGELVFCGIGYLQTWDPFHPRHAKLQVPPGWYSVSILGYVLNAGQVSEEWVYEFVLSPSKGRPKFHGDLSAGVSLYP